MVYKKKVRLNILSRLPFLLLSFTAFLFSSCENDPQTVNTLTARDNSPVQSAKNIEILYSDSAVIKAKLVSKQLDKYVGEDPYVEFTKGIEAYFYDEGLKETSRLKANYAISHENKKIMEAKKNVEVVNEKGEKLNTEHLIWDQNKQILYSNVFVKVTTADEVIFGEGFEADQDFTRYKILKIKGTINLKDE